MSIHTRFAEQRGASSWLDVDFIAVVSVEADEVVILNSDGSETRLLSAAGDFRRSGGDVVGTVTGVQRTSEGGGTVYESVNGINVGAVDLLSANGRLFDLLLDTAVSLGVASFDQLSLFDVLHWQGALASTEIELSIADFSAAQTSVVEFLEPETSAAPSGSSYIAADVVIGSPFDDWLAASGNVNVVAGNSGNDTLAGGAGSQILIGGDGSDWVDYSAADGPLMVNLSEGVATSADGSRDVLFSIENVIGSAFGDEIIGGAGANILRGGRGNDIITLGDGRDTIAFAEGDGIDTVTDFGADDAILLLFGSISSFGQLVTEQRLLTVDGHVEISLGTGNSIVLENVTSHTLLTAAQFRFG